MQNTLLIIFLWLVLAFPAHAANIEPAQVYAEHLEYLTFYSEDSIDDVIVEVKSICGSNQEILAWHYTWYPSGIGTIWDIRYDWRTTTKLLHGFGQLQDRDLAMQQKAEGVLRELIRPDMSEYQKISAIYQWVQDFTEYNWASYERFVNGNGIDRRDASQSAASVFFDGRAVCAGYADAFYYLANLADINCVLVHGCSHMWCAVQLNDRWYFVDPTDESGRCFLRGTEWAIANGYDWSECYLSAEVSDIDYKKEMFE